MTSWIAKLVASVLTASHETVWADTPDCQTVSRDGLWTVMACEPTAASKSVARKEVYMVVWCSVKKCVAWSVESGEECLGRC